MSDQNVSFMAWALPGLPIIQAGDDLVKIISASLNLTSLDMQDGDVLVVSSKIVSRAEGRMVRLDSVTPGEEAKQLAEETAKDPRIVELVLRESVGVSRKAKNVLVVEHRLGFVSANAGIDQSNVNDQGDSVLLLPENPDQSAQQLRRALQDRLGVDIGVVISDTHGRPFRLGNIGVAVGVAGLPALVDRRGDKDLFGRKLQATLQGYADLVASAAHLLCGEGDEGRPVILLRGLDIPPGEGHASDLNRPPEQDLYR